MANNHSNNQGQPSDDGEYEYIFVKYITLRNGKRVYAASKGKKAFRIRVRRRRK